MIKGRYTLFSRIPLYLEGDDVLTDPLWAKDLELHLPYITNFAICATVQPRTAAPDTVVRVQGLRASQVEPLRADRGYGSILKNLIPNLRSVIRALRQTRVAHSGGAGWAFPLSFYILVLSPFYKFDWIVLIESSVWMKPTVGRATPRQWVRHHVYRKLLGRCLRHARARIFTTDNYRRFFNISQENTLIAPAVWLDESAVITEAEQAARLADLPVSEARLVFPARLTADKGIDVIIKAVQIAETRLPETARAITIDIIGTGPLADTCAEFAKTHTGRIAVKYLEPVTYGAPFFDLLRSYHAVLLANRQHEQPRVVFDAFGQGVAVISSATQGVCEIVDDGSNALLYGVDDATALADCIVRIADDPTLAIDLASNAHAASHGWSHDGMHKNRHAFLARTLSPDVIG